LARNQLLRRLGGQDHGRRGRRRGCSVAVLATAPRSVSMVKIRMRPRPDCVVHTFILARRTCRSTEAMRSGSNVTATKPGIHAAYEWMCSGGPKGVDRLSLPS
jgi:hypothetical protein